MNKNFRHKLDELLNSFESISLQEMDKVKLMDRVDSKFVLSVEDLLPVIDCVKPNYNLLTINNNRIFSYKTDYFDTPDYEMFEDHHNGKLNRYKVRLREYVESDVRYLEVKFKSNKGRVKKNRIINTNNDNSVFNDFITKHTPYSPDLLKITLISRFNRFTLVDKNMRERVTFDINLCFTDRRHITGLSGLAIVEVKQNKNNRYSVIYNALKERGIRPDSFSKYCLGIALLARHNKLNNFKRTVNLINKLSLVEISELSKTG